MQKEYWEEKSRNISKDGTVFEGWTKEQQIIVRKIIIARLLKLPVDNLDYYLENNMWMKDFALKDTSSLSKTLFESDAKYEKKASEIITSFFYLPEEQTLLKMYKKIIGKDFEQEEGHLTNIRKILRELPYVIKKKESLISSADKDLINQLISVYISPIELINGHLEERVGSEVYYTILMEQWKTANEMAAEISNKRTTMNNFYTTLFAAMISAIVALIGIVDVSAWVIMIGSILGILLCLLWRNTIQGYKLLNAAKYEVINEMEKSLPANVMRYEWDGIIGNPGRTEFKQYSELSKAEKGLVWLFIAIFSTTFVFSAVCLIFPRLL